MREQKRNIAQKILDSMKEHYDIHSKRPDADNLWFLANDKKAIKVFEEKMSKL